MLHRWIERCAVVGVAAMTATLAWRLGPELRDPAAWLVLAAALLVSHVVADLLSGVVHWCADRVLDEEIAYFGPRFVRPFRQHHEDPLSILRYGFFETNGNTCIVALPWVAAACAWAEPAAARPSSLFGGGFGLFLTLWLCLTNQIHKWAHAPRPPAAVRCLQRARLILEGGHHATHHSPPFDVHFCITAGWLNPLLDRLQLFAALERLLSGASRARAGGSVGR